MSMGDTEETIEDIEGTAEEEETLAAGAQRRRFFGPPVIRTLLYIAAALVLIIVSATVAYFVAQRVGTPPRTEKTSPEMVEKEKPLAYYNLEQPFSVNTSDTDEPHFLKLEIQLGYDEGKAELQGELIKRRPEIRDIVISIVGAKKYNDLDTQDERDALKKEILNRVNGILIEGKIKKVVFTDFVLT